MKSLWPWTATAVLVLLTGSLGMTIAETSANEASSGKTMLCVFGPGSRILPCENAQICSPREMVSKSE